MTEQKWVFNRDGVPEEVPLERWIWGVVYDDGTELHQFDDKGVFHQIKEIDQSRVRLWVLYQPKGVGNGRIDFLVPEGTEVSLVHKYRNFIFNAATPQEFRKRAYVFGYKIKGNKPHYNFVMPNDAIIQSYGEQEPKLSLMGLQ